MHDFRLWRDLACTPATPQQLGPHLACTPSPAKAEESGTISNTSVVHRRSQDGMVRGVDKCKGRVRYKVRYGMVILYVTPALARSVLIYN